MVQLLANRVLLEWDPRNQGIECKSTINYIDTLKQNKPLFSSIMIQERVLRSLCFTQNATLCCPAVFPWGLSLSVSQRRMTSKQHTRDLHEPISLSSNVDRFFAAYINPFRDIWYVNESS